MWTEADCIILYIIIGQENTIPFWCMHVYDDAMVATMLQWLFFLLLLLFPPLITPACPGQLSNCWLVAGVKVPTGVVPPDDRVCTANPLKVFIVPVSVTETERILWHNYVWYFSAIL